MQHKETHRTFSLDLVDTHSGGDVSRVVVGGVKSVSGDTVRQKQQYFEAHGDGLRRLLLNEPYGDPAMSVNLIVEPCNPRAQAGYIIMEAMGYPMYSGSNTICTATAVLESGILEMVEGDQPLILESPAGLAHIMARNRNGHVQSITTQGEPAYVQATGLVADVPGLAKVAYDVVWSGAFFAMVDVGPLGFELVRDEEIALAAFGDRFVRQVRSEFVAEHPELGDVGPLPFVHFMGPVAAGDDGGFHARSATYVHPGVICRSPTGTGTSARLALMYERGQIRQGDWLETTSPRNSTFRGNVLGAAVVHGIPALNSSITGQARVLAHSRVVVDLDDPLVEEADLALVLGD